jgi:hypothetical protein
MLTSQGVNGSVDCGRLHRQHCECLVSFPE